MRKKKKNDGLLEDDEDIQTLSKMKLRRESPKRQPVLVGEPASLISQRKEVPGGTRVGR